MWLWCCSVLQQVQVTPWCQAVPQTLNQHTFSCTNFSIFAICSLNLKLQVQVMATACIISCCSGIDFAFCYSCGTQACVEVGRYICNFAALSSWCLCSLRRLVSLAYSFRQSCMMSLTQQGKTSSATSMVSRWSPVKSCCKIASPQAMTPVAFTATKRA